MARKSGLALCAAAAFAVFTGMAAVDVADARVRRQVTVHGEHGAAHAEVRRSRGSRTRDATVTGPDGEQRTSHDERRWNRRAGSYSRDHATTFADGTTRRVDTDIRRTGRGEFSVSREVTGRDGETRTQNGDFAVERAANVRTVTGDIETSNHGHIDYTRSVARENGARNINSAATFEDGTSIARSSTASCANGVCTSSGVITGRDGGQTRWQATRTRTENGVRLRRQVTYPDGTTRIVDQVREGDGDGEGAITRTVTDRNGETTTHTGEYEIDRTP